MVVAVMDCAAMSPRARPTADDLLRTLYGAVAEPEWAQEFLEKLCRATRSTSAAIVATDVQAKRDSLPAWVGAEVASARAYEKTYSAKNPWRGADGPLAERAGTVLVSDDACGLAELKRSAFWSDFLRPMGVAHGAGVIGIRTEREVASLTLLRSEKAGVYAGQDLKLLQVLAAHWANACAIRARLGLLVDAERGLAHVLDRVGLAVYLLDDSGRLLRTNAVGESLLASGDIVSVVRGRLTPAYDAAVFAQTLDKTAAPPVSGGAPPARALALRDRRGRVQAQAAMHAMAGALGARALLFVQPVAAGPQVQSSLHAVLKDAFGLTEREAALACRLAAGDDLAAASDTAGVTRGAGRTRLKLIFGKTGTSGQADLARFLAALRAVVGNGL